MKIIKEPIRFVLDLLKPQSMDQSSDRLANYCFVERVDEGTLYYNRMTKELLFLDQNEEFSSYIPYLKEHGFYVPDDFDEIRFSEELKELVTEIRKMQNHSKYSHLTVLTTSDCNARCYYCYETGCEKMTMDRQTADALVEWMVTHCNTDKEIHINWFGGEPLYNVAVIDRITDGLKKKNISYRSGMISNAYLIDDGIVERMKNDWNLTNMQITLDGTEEIYNRTKAYMGVQEKSPYQKVLRNIEKVTAAGIRVAIRLNLSFENKEDLLKLSKELTERFRGNGNLTVYVAILYQIERNSEDPDKKKKMDELTQTKLRLMEELKVLHYDQEAEIKKGSWIYGIRANHCMADSEDMLTILPDGRLASCEHFNSGPGAWGSIFTEEVDQEKKDYWKERWFSPECKNCKTYLGCIKLKNCPAMESYCTEEDRKFREKRVRKEMLKTYQDWRLQS